MTNDQTLRPAGSYYAASNGTMDWQGSRWHFTRLVLWENGSATSTQILKLHRHATAQNPKYQVLYLPSDAARAEPSRSMPKDTVSPVTPATVAKARRKGRTTNRRKAASA